MKYQYYEPEDSLEYKNILTVIFVGVILSFFTSIIYTLLGAIPLIYVKALITIGYGFSFGYIIKILSKIFKLKNFKSRMIALIPIVLIGYYFQWTHYIVNIATDGIPSFKDFAYYSFSPNSFFIFINKLIQNGAWEVSNTLIKGFNLKLVWMVEFLLIIIVPILFVLKLPNNPYSESLNKWYPKYILTKEFEKIYSKARFVINLKKLGSQQMTTTLGRGRANNFSRISIFYLERESRQYIMVEKVEITSGNNTKTKIETVVEPIEISTKEAKELMDIYEYKKESYLEF